MPVCVLVVLSVFASVPGDAAPVVRALGAVATGDNPTGIVFSNDGTSALVACMDAGRVDVLDVATRTLRQSVFVGRSPSGLVLRRDGSAWVGDLEADRLALIVPEFAGSSARWILDPDAGLEVGEHIALASARDGWGRVHVPVFTGLIVFGGELVAIDPDAGRVLGRRDVPAAPVEARVSPDGAQLACSSYMGGEMVAWDLYADEALGTLDVGSRPAGFAYTPDGSALLCAVRGEDRVAVIDTVSWTVRGSIDADVGPEPIAVAVSGPWAFVLNYDADDVSVIDLRERPWRVCQRVSVGRKPWFARAHPTRRELWVSCKGSEEVHVLGWDAPEAGPTTLLVLGTLGARQLVSDSFDLDVLAATIERLAPDVVLAQVAADPPGAASRAEPAWAARARASAVTLGARFVPVGEPSARREEYTEQARRSFVRDPALASARQACRIDGTPWQDAVDLGPAHPTAVGARLVDRVRDRLRDGVSGERVLLIVGERHVAEVLEAFADDGTLAVEAVPTP